MGPANSIDQGCKVRCDVLVEGRMVFVGVGIIVLAAVRSIATGKVIRPLGMNKVDLVKVRVWGLRSQGVMSANEKC